MPHWSFQQLYIVTLTSMSILIITVIQGDIKFIYNVCSYNTMSLVIQDY